jgi:hypothetical protein
MTIIYDSPTTTYDSGSVTYEGSGGASTGYVFTPPLIKVVPTFLPDSTPLEKSLWLHFENRVRGVNVWILSDGSVVQSDPTPENSNTDMTDVYPWDVNNPAAPYVRSIFIDSGANPQVATEHVVVHTVYPVANFYGGSSYPITTAQYTLLLNYTAHGAGYADCLTPL